MTHKEPARQPPRRCARRPDRPGGRRRPDRHRRDRHGRHDRPSCARRPIAQPTATSTGTAGRSVRDIYKQEGRGVVFIQSQGVSTDSGSPFGAPQQGTATGSGFVVDNDGTIVTNAHVVEGADSVTGSLRRERRVRSTPTSRASTVDTDIAVLKIDPSKVSSDLTPIPLGDSLEGAGGRPGRRDRQPVRLQPHGHHRHRLRRSSARSRRPTASRSQT